MRRQLWTCHMDPMIASLSKQQSFICREFLLRQALVCVFVFFFNMNNSWYCKQTPHVNQIIIRCQLIDKYTWRFVLKSCNDIRLPCIMMLLTFLYDKVIAMGQQNNLFKSMWLPQTNYTPRLVICLMISRNFPHLGSA